MSLSHIDNRRYFIKSNAAEIKIIWNGERYDGCNFSKFESNFEPNITQVDVLGSNVTIPLEGSGSLTFTATLKKASSRIAVAAYDLITNLKTTVFDIEIYTRDTNSYYGEQIIIYKDCMLSTYTIDSFENGNSVSEMPFNGSATGILVPKVFTDAKINGLTIF